MALRYDRLALANNELWRAISGHFIHLGWRHLIMNVVALLLLAALFERAWRATDIVLGGLFCAALISTGLYFFHPQVGWYVGYSGILHGLFVIASLRLLPTEPKYAALLILGVALKLAYEMLFGSAQDPEWLGGAVVEQSHFWGAIGGLLYGVAALLTHQSSNSR